MSLVGLVNLAERLLNQGSTQGQDPQTAQKAASTPPTRGAQGTAEDLFTPSAQNALAQDAGLFSVAQLSFFSAAADFLLGQATPQQPAAAPAVNTPANATQGAAQAAVPGAATTPALANLSQPSANANAAPAAANFATTTAKTQATAPAAPTAAAATATATTTSAAPGSLTVRQQLQSLNTALAALGLSPQQIQQLDQIASIINDFNPTAFTSLAFQLEELAQATQAAPTPAPATAGNAQGAATNAVTSNTNAAPTSGAPPAGFQLQELVIKFAGVQVRANTPANGNTTTAPQAAVANGNGNLQISAFNVQIEEVNLTLVNGSGQTARIQAPTANANQPAAPKARAANG